MRAVSFIVFCVGLFNFRNIINKKLADYSMRCCSYCLHLFLVLIHFPIGVLAIVSIFLAADDETNSNDVRFAVTKIAFTMEQKIELLLMLYVIIKVNQHYMVVKGVIVYQRMAREREILASDIYSDCISNRSFSMHSSGSVSHESIYSRQNSTASDQLLNRSDFDNSASYEAPTLDADQPRFVSNQNTSNTRIYSEGIASLFLKYDPGKANT